MTHPAPGPRDPSQHVVFFRDPECRCTDSDAREYGPGDLRCETCSRPIRAQLCPKGKK